MSDSQFNPLDHPVCLERPLWMDVTAWAEHIPFAMYLISALKPRLFVELGTFRGVSYCAFCQAVKAVGAKAKCFAVDTWEGDEHAGKLEAGVLSKLHMHHDPLYSDFSTLLRKTFDEALADFDDGSIDLLHIDGFHTYEAVKHDFDTWLPKLSDRGVVLFHDIAVRERGFGVWRFWDELCTRFPNFSFAHGFGLGVLFVGSKISKDVEFLVSADGDQIELIRAFFEELGRRIELARVLNEQNHSIRHLRAAKRLLMNSFVMRLYSALRKKGIAGAGGESPE